MLIRFLDSRLLFAPDAGGGSGTEDDDETPVISSTPEGALDALKGENYKLREQRRALKADRTARDAEIATLRGQLPQAGALVLNGEQASLWQSYQALGQPADLTAALSERDTLKAQTTERAWRDQVSEAATLSGYKSSVLEDRLKASNATVIIKDEQAAGKSVKVAYVVDADKKETLLTTYAETAWPDYLAALKPAATTTAPQLGTPQRGAPQPGQQRPAQGSAGAPGYEPFNVGF